MSLKIEKDSPSVPLVQALKDYREKSQVYLGWYEPSEEIDRYIKAASEDKELGSIGIKKFLTRGSSAIVFETAEGDVLKLTETNHFPMGRPHESFDVPIIRKGKTKGIYYYIEEKLMQHGLTEGFVKTMKNMISERGYRSNDLDLEDTHQIGISKDGKLYLLDPECAKYKNIFHALYSKLKLAFKRIRI